MSDDRPALIGLRPCGCIQTAMCRDFADEHPKERRKLYLEAEKDGLEVRTVPNQFVRDNPWGCETCQPGVKKIKRSDLKPAPTLDLEGVTS